MNDSFTTTEERNEILGGKKHVIEPYIFEPNKGDKCEASDDSSEDSGSEEEEFESFCCHEKAVEYDEYDKKLTSAQNLEFSCITSLSSFVQNMLLKDVLDVDVLQYLEENWPLGDDQLEKTHELYRLVSCRGKKCAEVPFVCLYMYPKRICFPHWFVHSL